MKRCRHILQALFLILSIAHVPAMAQIQLIIRKDKPLHPKEHTWFVNPFTDLKIELYRNGKWETMPYLCSENPRIWHGFVLVTNGDDKTIVKEDGTPLIDRGLFLFAKDSIIGAFDANDDWVVVNHAGDTLSRYKVIDTAPLDWVNLHGERGACFPKYATGYPDLWDIDIHNWGILGTKGIWIIPPIFDAPFKFEHGFAEVLYYGEWRLINEKGEFVD